MSIENLKNKELNQSQIDIINGGMEIYRGYTLYTQEDYPTIPLGTKVFVYGRFALVLSDSDPLITFGTWKGEDPNDPGSYLVQGNDGRVYSTFEKAVGPVPIDKQQSF